MHSKEDILYRTILIVTVIIGIIILCFLLSVIRQQRKWRKLNAEKFEIEINTLENERKRLAADLHDELGGVLTAMKFKLESIECATQADQMQVNQCVHLVRNMVAKIRWISNALLPDTLAHKGIISAVMEYANLVTEDSELKIIVENAKIPEIATSRSVHIFRILVEIIHNTLKHSKAGTLKIEFLTENDKLVVLTADDGKGFDYQSAVHSKKGLGLNNLQNRTELLGGEFHLLSHPGRGTRCHIRIPL
ncbi:MAG: sensor histidine kinase [Ginsengibacter sp.]